MPRFRYDATKDAAAFAATLDYCAAARCAVCYARYADAAYYCAMLVAYDVLLLHYFVVIATEDCRHADTIRAPPPWICRATLC